MYNSNFYQRIKDLNYRVVLPLAIASFGVGYFLNMYFSERKNQEIQGETASLERKLNKIDPPINIVIKSDKIISCTEEDMRDTEYLFTPRK